MSIRTTIKKILLENNKRYNKFAYNVIKYAYNNIRINQYSGKEGEFKSKFGSVDNWIRNIKLYFFEPMEKQKSMYSLDKAIDYGNNPLIDGIKQTDIIKMLSEFIVNFEESGEKIEVDVISGFNFDVYLEKNYFKCTNEFFEFVWDVYLKDARNHWNESPKDKYWEEIKDGVIEKMEDVEWQEENGVSFDRLNNEKEYFMSYWHYPMDSLGWDRDDLCEFYKDMLSAMGDEKLKQVIMFHDNQFVNSHLIGDELYYIIDKDKFLF